MRRRDGSVGSGSPPRASTLVMLVVMLAVVSLVSAGCAGWDQMQFRQDHRLQIVAPRNLSTVSLPFTVRWEDAASGEEQTNYAIFMDRYPMAPGEGLRDLVADEPFCGGGDLCLEPQYLREQFGIYVTSKTHATVDYLPQGLPATADDSHYATIVLLDEAGNRVGESVWYVSFKVSS